MPIKRYDPRYFNPKFIRSYGELQSQLVYFCRPSSVPDEFEAVVTRSSVTNDIFIFVVGREYWNNKERYQLNRIFWDRYRNISVNVTCNGAESDMLLSRFLSKLISDDFPMYAKSVIPWGM